MVEERGFKKTLRDIYNLLKSGEDSAGRVSFNTAFGDKITVERHADIEEQFHYNVNTETLTTTTANSGAASVENDMLKLSSSTNTAGSVKVTTKHIIRYRPGFEGYALFTALWENEGVATSVQHIGPVTDNDGYYIGYTNTNFVVGRRAGGTDTEVVEANFNGGDISGMDKTKLNIFRITWGWLGTATITFEWKSQTGWVIMHQMLLENSLTQPHVYNPVLPIQAEITKTAGATDIIMRSGSWNGGMMGEDIGAGDRFFLAHVDAAAVSTQQVLFSLENQATFQSKTNRVEVEMILINAATDGTKSVELAFYRNLAITSPSWTNINATNSVMRIDTAGTVTPNTANLEFEFGLAKVDSILLNSEKLGLIMEPGDTYTITGASASNNDIHLAVRWKEHF